MLLYVSVITPKKPGLSCVIRALCHVISRGPALSHFISSSSSTFSAAEEYNFRCTANWFETGESDFTTAVMAYDKNQKKMPTPLAVRCCL
ncbi:hypothetical protein AVEN_56990-1 [Araneus ventricosus]|uniref:Uncharacterized protein n=1 Tax=Araneus ventricosus TaxID=182803 RepID=A0A4Y2NKW9_ARAVE|nr:hypothetical protein AVEN_56990-1 [Araneus ventricosus]